LQQNGGVIVNTEGWKKFSRLFRIIALFQGQNRSWRTKEIAEQLEINEDTANDYLNDLSYSGILPVTRDSRNMPWYLPEGAVIPHLELSLSYSEAVSLYLAGRLLAQTQDEQNWHMTMALQKLIEALPPSLQEQQKMLMELLLFEDAQRPNLSNIFQAIASGWVKRQSVRLTYEPPGGNEFDCFFDPYLLEPSAIGRTIYVLGYSSASKALRTYKLERIKRAELTGKTFELSSDFKGAEQLQQAWIVMYSEETPVRVRLRFSAAVTPRVRETRWHPNQDITLTRDGCEWTALIGDTLEIEPWVRGWGCECEVLEPLELRQTILSHLQRSMQVYGLNAPAAVEPRDPTVFNRNLFKKKEQ
jgi:predicted DNA-binding transcriptional regulator YafY